ncbi:hypothetical protein DXG03_001156 [Asterophora parasitica]|uniref:DUF7330 domain-containing protein n=1 Tax=Asterophora parasitica TaxID=117018 RepID=A0A9P7GHH9_9AGAR|nr:hypothetical protein DXG03_001156 [Asterophora parasitica]
MRTKSIIDLFSRFGSVNAEIIRLAGAEQHHFKLHVTSSKENVKLLLPARFQGYIGVTGWSRDRVNYNTELRRGIKRGEIRVNNDAQVIRADEDEVHVHAAGNVEIRLMEEESLHPSPVVWYWNGNQRPTGRNTDRINRLRRWLGLRLT